MNQPDDSFLGQVHDLLCHIYDNPHLQNHPLAEQLAPGRLSSPRERLRFLRTAVLEAIEELNPGSGVPLRELRARSYSVITLHYVEGLAIDEVARQLAISERQVYRDLRKAEQELASLLWSRRQGTAGAPKGPARADLVLEEAGRVASHLEPHDLKMLVEGAIAAVAPLGQQRGVRLQAELGGQPRVIHTDRSLARQALISLLSNVAQTVQDQTAVVIGLCAMPAGARVEIRYVSSRSHRDELLLPPATQQLLRCIGARWQSRFVPGGQALLTLSLTARAQASVLVIDDNAGLFELFRRYLADQPLQLLEARSGEDGLRLAAESMPDSIVLDVMMPQKDGWEVLQALRDGDQTRHIPVIICSVLDDPQLALALGASAYIAKPVTRAQLLRTLTQHVPGLQTEPRPASSAGA
ncbi:MAG: response regulator [Anaerolineae bacterium]